MSNHHQQTISNVNRLFSEVFHGGEFSLAEEILTSDFTFQYPFPGFSAGPEGIVEFSKVIHTAFPSFELEINDLFGSVGHLDTRVGIRWTLRGTHAGHFMGIPASKEYVTLSAIGMYMSPFSADGKLSSGWLELDTLGMLQQVNAVHPMEKLLPELREK